MIEGIDKLVSKVNTNSDDIRSLRDLLEITIGKLNTVETRLGVTEDKLRITEHRLQVTEEKLNASNQNLVKTSGFLKDTVKELQETKRGLVKANDQIAQMKLNMDKNFSIHTESETKKTNKTILKKNVEFGGKHKTVIHISPKIPPEVFTLLTNTTKQHNESTEIYVDRIKRVVNMMEPNQLYKMNDMEIYVKVDVTQHQNKTIGSYFQDVARRAVLKNLVGTYFYSNELCLYADATGLQVLFLLPEWNTSNAKTYLLNPVKKAYLELPNCQTNISNETVVNNMVLIKAVLEI